MEEIKLFCIPHAGGSAVLYKQWSRFLEPGITLIPIELAGRGIRAGEDFYQNFDEMVRDVQGEIGRYLGQERYAIYGHSMGCWVAMELCNLLSHEGNGKMPESVFFSGNCPPQITQEKHDLGALTDEEIIKMLLDYGGTPKEVFENEGIKKYILELIRADYRLLERYLAEKNHTVNQWDTNIVALYGSEDEISAQAMEQWKDYSGKDFDLHRIPGNHFFVSNNLEDVTTIINKTLT